MKKRILIVSLVFLLTGCTVQDNLTISKDLSVEEKIHMGGTESFFLVYNKTSPSRVIDMMLNKYSSEKTLEESGYTYEKEVSKNFKGIIASKDYSSISEYTTSSIFYNQLFKNINYEENGSVIKITTEDFLPYNPQDPNRYAIKEFTLNIRVPFSVTESNADDINKKKNIFTWKINSETKTKEIILQFDKNIPFIENINIYIPLIVILVLTTIAIIYIKKQITYNKKNNRI